jgi:glycosyltransferase involved in cell wall biosynthesis
MGCPRASILTSIYNGEKFVDGFLRNAITQTFIDQVEILLLDANSSDRSEEIIKKYEHPSLKYIKLDKKYSIYEAWNIGIGLSKSPILSNWNIDDRRKNNSIETQTVYMENNPLCDVCYGYVAWSFKQNETFEENSLADIYPCLDVSLSTMIENNSPHCMPFWRKSLHDKLGLFDTTYPTAADFEFWMKSLYNGSRFDKIYDIVGSYYHNPNGLSTSSQSSNMTEGMEIKQKYIKLFNEKGNLI